MTVCVMNPDGLDICVSKCWAVTYLNFKLFNHDEEDLYISDCRFI